LRAYLNGGPNHGKVISIVPGTREHYVTVAKPIDIMFPFISERIYPADSMPVYEIARYEFSGTGVVDAYGACSAVILNYAGKEEKW
jgi:hypothetical protein